MKQYKYAAAILIFLTCGLARIATGAVPIFNQFGQAPIWSSMPIPFWISAAGSSQIPNGSEFPAVQAAFQSWQSVSLASVSFKYIGTTPVSTVGRDGINVVTFADDTVPLGSATVSATFSFMSYDSTGTLTFQESDIALNPAIPFSTSAEPGKYDIQGIVTHEVGHFLGLGNSPLLSAVMAPRSAPGQLDQRTLTFDDMAGLASSYPNNPALASYGALSGSVFNGTTGLFGVHVIAIDANGTAVTSVLSDADGSYYFPFLVPGNYRIVAEPLDGPVSESDVGGNASSYFYQLDTGFGTTYYGDVADLNSARTRTVTAGREATNTNIHVLGSSNFNLLSPGTFSMRIGTGAQTNLTVGGIGLVGGTTFSVSGTGVTTGAPSFGGSISGDSPTSAIFGVAVSTATATGPKNIALSQGGATSILAGGLVVTTPPPSGIQVGPPSGTTDGGLQVTVTGQNFQAGAAVYFGGLLASNIAVVDSQTVRATTPANTPGAATVVVMNPDGTWGAQAQSFAYTAATPSITAVSPLSGAPQSMIQIQGTGFDTRIQNVAVQFNGTPATVISTSRTSIQVAVPYNASTGSVSVNILGQIITGPNFTVSPAPATSNAPSGFAFLDASPSAGGSALSMADPDDSAALVQLPFTFTLFNKTYAAGTTISISTNGWLSLDAVTAPDYRSVPLPGTTASAMIAPYFDDLFVRSGGSVWIRTLGTAPNRRFVVEWSNVGVLNPNAGDTGAVLTFEAVLYETSNDIQFLYQSATGPDSDGSTATIGFQNSARTTAVMASYDQATVSSGLALSYQFTNGNYVRITGVPSTFTISSAGVVSFVTTGASPKLTVGYSAIQQSAGAAASGVAIFDYRTNGVLVTEAAVPASGLIQHGRIYAVVGASGNVSSNTGVAIANPNPTQATITFNFTDANGNDYGDGTALVPANGQIAKFINEAPFNALANAVSSLQGTMTFSSSVPVSVIALQGLINERSEFLITTLPVIDLSIAPASGSVTIPHFASGGGWTTQVVLVNTASVSTNGTIQFVAADGTALTSAPFAIAARSSFVYQTSGSGTTIQTGSVRITPAGGNSAPTALTIFSFKSNGVTVTQAGVPTTTGTALRTYVEASGAQGTPGSVRSGIAIANTSSSAVNVVLNLSDLAGNPVATTTLSIAANSQKAAFLNELFAQQSLPLSLQGMLEIKAPAPGVSAAGLRGRYNERGDFLETTTPMLDETATINGRQYFPHFADGGGYTTQFIVFTAGSGQTASGSLIFAGQDGSVLNVVLNK
jgi:hypothetical protein